MGEQWKQRQARVRAASPYGHLHAWRLLSVMVKSRDDVRQEQFAVQLITLFSQIFKKAGLPLFVRPYHVLATNSDAGLIEIVNDTVSLHGLKKKLAAQGVASPTLKHYFNEHFGGEGSPAATLARQRFARSLAAYGVICYILQIKDRHNGNILIDASGHVVHIDFGFMLSNSPGNINFEKAAFKLTRDFVDVMGGEDSEITAQFTRMCVQGYLAARQHARQIQMLVEITRAGQPDLPCFQSASVLEELEDRFKTRLSREQAAAHFSGMIREAMDSWYTRQYDKFQRLSNGIFE
eukprot:CAMPEP_0180280490 /NCGR_PEP_ID=MMETSP0988-20121125/8662_1 /TAXON_ID=697907 /ORGANISM="non described non described, Strain CCMP2293" /LENGTH=292 /DNA_ID=CAMNT_0022252343 /DNA_START=117 /DNA_END=995 /DNA_ORIENTATION=+